MNNWNFYRIYHSQKNMIDLYCRQLDNNIEIYITDANENDMKALIHDILIGKLDNLVLDQYSNKIDWRITKFNFDNFSCEDDMCKARKRHSHMDNLDYLKYHIANAINITYNNRGFSKYLKKNILGKWTSNDLSLVFNNNGEYYLQGNPAPKTILIGIPNKGNYYFSRNMMFLLRENNSGLRTQVVDLIDNKIIFPGFSGRLFFTIEKE